VCVWLLPRLFFGVFLTPIVPVYLFTGLFILAGSMKSGSRSGYASLAVYVACGVGLLLVQPASAYEPTAYARENLDAFGGLIGGMAMIVPGSGHALPVAIGGFLWCAYTDHYLNQCLKMGGVRRHP